MALKRNPASGKATKPASAKSKPESGASSRKQITPEEGLEPRVLEVLEDKGVGLTCAEVGDACRVAWRRGLAIKMGSKQPEAGSIDTKNFIYDMWKRGLVFVEPPSGRYSAVRIWSMKIAREKFPLTCQRTPTVASEVKPLSTDLLKRAYNKYVPEHLGGFVPIYKVRRELAVPKDVFDKLLRELNELDDPIVELLGGDPQKFTEDQRNDSLYRGNNLFLRMRWRKQ